MEETKSHFSSSDPLPEPTALSARSHQGERLRAVLAVLGTKKKRPKTPRAVVASVGIRACVSAIPNRYTRESATPLGNADLGNRRQGRKGSGKGDVVGHQRSLDQARHALTHRHAHAPTHGHTVTEIKSRVTLRKSMALSANIACLVG